MTSFSFRGDTLRLVGAVVIPGVIVCTIGLVVTKALAQLAGVKGCYYQISSVQNQNGGCDGTNYESGDKICIHCETVGNPCPDYHETGGIHEIQENCFLGLVQLDDTCISNCIAKKGSGGGGEEPPIDPPDFAG